MYELRLTRKAQKFYQDAEDDLVRRLNRCFEQLRQDPFDHPNSKQLKGSFAGSLRYRVGDLQRRLKGYNHDFADCSPTRSLSRSLVST